jgi:hypothetical protein
MISPRRQRCVTSWTIALAIKGSSALQPRAQSPTVPSYLIQPSSLAFASFPGVKSAGYELVILGFLIGDAERRAWHRDDKNTAGDPEATFCRLTRSSDLIAESSPYGTSILDSG